jgi:ferredoxin
MNSEITIKIDQKAGSTALSQEEIYSLYSFFATGKLEDKKTFTLAEKNLTSIHFNTNPNEIHEPFPLYIPKQNPNRIAVTVDEMFEILAQNENASDAELQKILGDLKIQIKYQLNGFSEEIFDKILRRSADILIESFKNDDKKIEALNKTINLFKNKLDPYGKVLALTDDAPLLYLHSVLNKSRGQKGTAFNKEVESIIYNLDGLLESNKLKSTEGKSSGSLESTVGDTFKKDLDFNALSEIVGESIMENTLPVDRISRISSTLNILKTFIKFFDVSQNIQTANGYKSVTDIKKAIQKYKNEVIDFFKALYIARLEVTNKYRSDFHDTFFKDFKLSYLKPEDLNCIPALLILVKENITNDFSYSILADILNTTLPVKILLINSNVIDSDQQSNEITTNNTARKIAGLAINLQKCYIIQSPLYQMPSLENNLLAAIDYNGPALFCINTLNLNDYTFTDYSQAFQALLNSRTFPVWYYLPDLKMKTSQRFHINLNPDEKEDWLLSVLEISHKGDENLSGLPVTFVDFIAQDKRFKNNFISIPLDKYHANLIPVHTYLNLSNLQVEYKIPYIIMQDDKGVFYKIIPDFQIINAAFNIMDDWHTLQELAAVKDTDAIPYEIPDKTKIDPAEPAKSKSEIQQEAITNILNRLISGDLEAREYEPQPQKTDIVTGENAKPIKEKDSLEMSSEERTAEITEPYIETALCTSCGDCININNMMFAYDENKQAYIKDVTKGSFKQLVMAAEKCPAFIIHPGKPKDLAEKDLDKLVKRAEKFNR